MKTAKIVSLLLVLLAVLSLSFFAVAEEGTESCTYTIYNVTCEKVVELYAKNFLTGEQGENYAGEGIENGGVVEITKTAKTGETDKEHFVIELIFVTESGYTGTFSNLHFETVPISLLAEADVATGATQISFFAPEVTATYTIYNVTGEKVVELYAKNFLTGEQGENYAGEGLENGAVLDIVKTAKADATDKEHYVIELIFVTESGYTGTFSNLHFETVPISLLAEADVATGATQISFFAPAK